MVKQSVGLASPRSIGEARKKHGIPEGFWGGPPNTGPYEWSANSPTHDIILTYNERMTLEAWQSMSLDDRLVTPKRHQPPEVRWPRLA
jgi:hypothetical protein